MKKLFPIALMAAILIGCNKGTDSTSSTATTDTPSTSAEGGAFDLKINVKKGEVYVYVMNMESTAPQAMKMEMNMAMTVADVVDGKSMIETRITGGKMNGAPLPAPQLEVMSKMVVKSTMDERGKVLDTKIEGSPDPNANAGSSNSVSFPDKPVKAGDKWTGETEVSGKKINADYTFIGAEEVDGKQMAHIQADVKSDSIKFDGPLHYWVELSNGMLYKMEFSGEDVASKTKMKMTMTRI